MEKIISKEEYNKIKINNKKKFIVYCIIAIILFILSVVFFYFNNTISNWIKEILEKVTNPIGKALIESILPIGNTIAIISSLLFMIVISKIFFNIKTPKSQKGKTKKILAESIVKYSLIIVSFILILKVWGADISSIAVTTGGVVVFLGLCLKSIVEDFVCGVIIVFEGNLSVGDIVSYSSFNFKGTIREIGTRVTIIENIHNDLLIVNNSKLEYLVNHSRHTTRVIQTILLPKTISQTMFVKMFKKNKKLIESKCPDIKSEISYYGIIGIDRFNTQFALEYYVKENRSLQTQKYIFNTLNEIFEKEGWLI